jgi:phosphatidylglycerophosphatase A
VSEHKNTHRAAIQPLNAPTLGLSVFGLGFLRPAPGTWGSLPPAAIAGIMLLIGTPVFVQFTVIATILVLSSIVCIAFGRYAERRFGRSDAPEVVADETAGQCLPLLLWPPQFVGSCLAITNQGIAWDGLLRATLAVGAAFLLFRIFDILKPWPANRLERLPAGWGVLADDLMAGVYAAIVMQVGLALLG